MTDDNIKGIKLMNGAEIVAKIVSETDTTYILEDAIYWDLVQVAENKFDVKFTPLTVGVELPTDAIHDAMNIPLSKSAVFFPYELRAEIKTRYQKLISPIELIAPSKIIH